MAARKPVSFWIAFWLVLLLTAATLLGIAPYPFFFVLLLGLVAVIFTSRHAVSSTARAVCINLAAVVAVFLVLEAHWINKKEFREQPVVDLQHDTGSRTKDPVLGFRRTPNYSEETRRTVNGQESYSASYSTDSAGLRITPAPMNPPDASCFVFMGCSFTFGVGVNDAESMPWQVASLSNRQTFNLAVSGYGPHQMLAAIEFDLLPELGACSSRVFVYQAIEDHVSRAAGLGKLGEFGPRYVLTKDGAVQYAGQFDDLSDTAGQLRWDRLFGKSYIYREYFVERNRIGADEINLYLAVVATTKQRLQQKYPGMRFIVLYWDNSDRSYAQELDSRLPDIADEYIRISDIIPDIRENQADWLLPLDPHPNARAHRAVAEYLVTRITPGSAPTL